MTHPGNAAERPAFALQQARPSATAAAADRDRCYCLNVVWRIT
jgi:hypothetical protein